MFGDPVRRPSGAIVLPFVWAYSIKIDSISGELIYKARGTCNGGKRYGKAVTMAETYATCVAQPACRLYWAITASEGLISIGADAGNAFAEAPPPVEPFYMAIDDQFHEWSVECLGNAPNPSAMSFPSNMHYRDTQNPHASGKLTSTQSWSTAYNSSQRHMKNVCTQSGIMQGTFSYYSGKWMIFRSRQRNDKYAQILSQRLGNTFKCRSTILASSRSLMGSTSSKPAGTSRCRAKTTSRAFSRITIGCP